MLSPPGSPALSNTHSPAALQNHIYSAFLERRTADVALHVRGSWHAIYKLHRVVLIQAVSRLSCVILDARQNVLWYTKLHVAGGFFRIRFHRR